jgi:hypothetical protein
MRKRILGSLAAVAAGAGLTYGQPPVPAAGPMGPPPGGSGIYSPDGHPVVTPPGMDGAVPHFSMGTGPGGAYGPGGPGGGGGGAYGTGPGIFAGAGAGASKYWFGADYLLWQPKSFQTDYPFVTTSAAADLGVLGRASTFGLCTDKNIAFGSAAGFRVWGGMAFDDAGMAGVEFGGFLLETRSKGSEFSGNSVGFPVLAIPFFDNSTGAAGSYVISFPGINTGSARVEAETRSWGAEANAVYNAFGGPGGGGGLQFLCGARYFELEERFSLNTTSTTFGVPPASVGGTFFPGGGGFFAGTDFSGSAPFTVTTSDSIRTFNEFYGAQVGFRGDACWGKWTLGFVGKAAAGINRQRVDITGESTLIGGGTASTQPGGIVFGAPDLCRVRKDRFAILPEGNINLGYNLTSNCRINVGYNFLYINSVVRPLAIAQPPNTDVTQIPTSPTFGGSSDSGRRDVLNDTDFYLHGFNFGFQISF